MHYKIASYNCNSIRNKIDIIREILDENDILFLQEIMLIESDISLLDDIHDDFECISSPSKYTTDCSFSGRPKGGLAIFCRKSILKEVKFKKFNDNVMGIIVCDGRENCLILNVYLPCDMRNDSSLDNYRFVIADLINITEHEMFDNIIIAGDFNADPYKGRFWREFNYFCLTAGLTVADMTLPQDTFTYLSPFA